MLFRCYVFVQEDTTAGTRGFGLLTLTPGSISTTSVEVSSKKVGRQKLQCIEMGAEDLSTALVDRIISCHNALLKCLDTVSKHTLASHTNLNSSSILFLPSTGRDDDSTNDIIRAVTAGVEAFEPTPLLPLWHQLLNRHQTSLVTIRTCLEDKVSSDSIQAQLLTEMLRMVKTHLVMTNYNKRLWKVTDVSFHTSVNCQMATDRTEPLTYVEYYRRQWNNEITDATQPLLVSGGVIEDRYGVSQYLSSLDQKHQQEQQQQHQQEHETCTVPPSAPKASSRLFFLVPELCSLTGLETVGFDMVKEWVDGVTQHIHTYRKLEEWETRHGIVIKDKRLLRQTFTHKSFSNNKSTGECWDGQSYDRLEFVGDSILDFIVSHILYLQRPHGVDTCFLYRNVRHSLVNNKHLAKVGASLDLSEFVLMSKQSAATAVETGPAVNSDVFEALLAALFMEGVSLESIQDLIRQKLWVEFPTEELLQFNSEQVDEPSTESASATSVQDFVNEPHVLSALVKLEDSIHVQFSNKELGVQVLADPSLGIRNSDGTLFCRSNLECLGDSLLKFVINLHLFKCYESTAESELTRCRHKLNSVEWLCHMATHMGIDSLLLHANPMLDQAGPLKSQTVGEMMKCLVAALYLDQGFQLCPCACKMDVAGDFIHTFIISNAPNMTPNKTSLLDPKCLFQHISQVEFGKTAAYKKLAVRQEEHLEVYVFGVYIGDDLFAQGEGYSVREASRVAAAMAVCRFKYTYCKPNQESSQSGIDSQEVSSITKPKQDSKKEKSRQAIRNMCVDPFYMESFVEFLPESQKQHYRARYRSHNR